MILPRLARSYHRGLPWHGKTNHDDQRRGGCRPYSGPKWWNNSRTTYKATWFTDQASWSGTIPTRIVVFGVAYPTLMGAMQVFVDKCTFGIGYSYLGMDVVLTYVVWRSGSWTPSPPRIENNAQLFTRAYGLPSSYHIADRIARRGGGGRRGFVEKARQIRLPLYSSFYWYLGKYSVPRTKGMN